MPVQLVLADLAIERIAMDAKNLSGLGLISTGLGESALNESLLEFAQSFVQINAAVDHFGDEGFQLLFHNFFLTRGSILFIFYCRYQRSNAR